MYAEEGTIESQVLELKRQIAAAGDVLVKEYLDDGYSGTLLDRPGLEELRSDVNTDLFEAVYFLDTDRIARDVAYQTIILGELLKYGRQIIIKGKDYVNNPENKFTVTVLGAVAELERAKIIKRTTRGRLHRLRMGELSSNGHRIYGYDYMRQTATAPATLVINEEQAPVVRSMFEMFKRSLRPGHHLALPRGASCADPPGTAAVGPRSDQSHAQERDVRGNAVLQDNYPCHGSDRAGATGNPALRSLHRFGTDVRG